MNAKSELKMRPSELQRFLQRNAVTRHSEPTRRLQSEPNDFQLKTESPDWPRFLSVPGDNEPRQKHSVSSVEGSTSGRMKIRRRSEMTHKFLELHRSSSARGRTSRMVHNAFGMFQSCYMNRRHQNSTEPGLWLADPPSFSRHEAAQVRHLWPADQNDQYILARRMIDNIFEAVPATRKLLGLTDVNMEQWHSSSQFRQQALALVQVIGHAMGIYTMVGSVEHDSSSGRHVEVEREMFEQKLARMGNRHSKFTRNLRDADWRNFARCIQDTVLEMARERACASESSAVREHALQQIELTMPLWKQLCDHICYCVRKGWLESVKSHRGARQRALSVHDIGMEEDRVKVVQFVQQVDF